MSAVYGEQQEDAETNATPVYGDSGSTIYGEIAAPFEPVSGPGAVNIVTGGGATIGFNGGGAPFGEADNTNPNPPDVGVDSLETLIQGTAGDWVVLMQPATIAQDAWTTCTVSSALGSVVLTSADALTYTADLFGKTKWTFAVSADIWHQLGTGANVGAVFA